MLSTSTKKTTSPIENEFSEGTLALYSSLLAIIIALSYNFLRIGFELHWMSTAKALGLVFLILNLPVVIDRANQGKRVFLSQPLISVSAFIALVLLGWLPVPVGAVVCLAGFAIFIVNFLQCSKSWRWCDLIALLLILILGFWFVFTVWHGGYLHPLLLELLPFDDRVQIDTLFHMSIAQMIKTYQIPSTGLNGLPFYHYHFGSHFIFASLSKLLDLHIFRFYQLAFPVIFLPLLFNTVGGIPLTYFERFNASRLQPLYPILVVTAATVGVLPTFRILSKGAADWSLPIVSESYCVSLIFAGLLTSVLIQSIKSTAGKTTELDMPIQSMLLILVLIFLIGVSKVSTLFLVDVVLIWTLIRIKAFKQFKLIILTLLIGILSLVCLWLCMDRLSNDGSFEAFHFYKTYVRLDPVSFFGVYYMWSVLAIVLYLIVNWKVSKSESVGRFGIELIIVSVVVGFIPGAIAQIDGGSAAYFMDVSKWISITVVILLLPSFFSKMGYTLDVIRAKTWKVVNAGIAIALLLIGMTFVWQNFYKTYKFFLMHNYVIRNWMAGKHSGDVSFRKKISIAEFLREQRQLSISIDSNLQLNPSYKLLTQLYQLDNISEAKAETILIPGNIKLLENTYPCYKSPFIVPALTGYALKDAFEFENCHGRNYSFEYYRRDLAKANYSPGNIKQISADAMGNVTILDIAGGIK